MALPEGFLWGCSTAAYQIEGGNRFSDLWDWEARKGWERSGGACRSWERMEEDLALLKSLGAKAYRFGVEWARVEPAPGKVDPAALERYARFAAALKDAGILPVVCLHHFTNPAWLHAHAGGWESPVAGELFVAHARRVAAAMKGSVRHWLTFNEPMVYLTHAYATGYFPPGRRALLSPLTERLVPAMAVMARAHREAREALRAADPDARVSVAQHLCPAEPASGSEADRLAAERWDRFFNWSFLDACHTGLLDADLDGTAEGALDGGGRGLDFTGINYYTRVFVRSFRPALRPLGVVPFFAEVKGAVGDWVWRALGGRQGPGEKDGLGHEWYPEGLTASLETAWKRYGVPVWVTENGLDDASGERRPEFLRRHAAALEAAAARGVPVEAYLHWSLLDNYEWGSYRPRFGLYKVDFADGARRSETPAAAEFRRLARPA